MTTTTRTRTITLTDRPPVRIREDKWPVIAEASGDSFPGADPALHMQAAERSELTRWSLKVRQHKDGRTIISGVAAAPVHQRDLHDWRGGLLLAAGENLVAAIREVGADGNMPDHLVRECIADLPAEDL